MGVISVVFIVTLLIRKKGAVYGAIVSGLTLFFCLFLLDATLLYRYMLNEPFSTGYDFSAEFIRITHNNEVERAQVLFNIAAFVPFGFLLSESLSSFNRFRTGRRVVSVTLCSFALSLSIECLQLFLRLGLFEITDLVMNTVGGLVGACLSIIGRRLFENKDTRLGRL